MIDQGHGSPVVLIPGLQGRWEWMMPTIAALAERHRVLSFSLGETADGDACFDGWLSTIDDLAERTGGPPIVLIGVSFGGLPAVRYAARHPERVSALVLVSVPSPRFHFDRVSAICLRHPVMALPLFVTRGCLRLVPEVIASRESWPMRLRLGIEYGFRSMRYPISPTRMACWVHEWQETNIAAECRNISAPTLLVTGEPHLDRVVPVTSTREYLNLIPNATSTVFRNTGHIGLVSQPSRFAEIVEEFLANAS